jgi:transposase
MSAVNRNDPKRAPSSDSAYTIMDFVRDYPDDATCLDSLWRRLYSEDGETATCPKCDKTRRFHRVKSRPSYSCDTCGHHIHPTAGTIFHKSSTSLHLWFHAVFLMAQTRCGISAKQLERELGVTYKTAWRMFKQIRSMLTQDDEPLSGTVEIDETFIGGKPRKGDIKSKQDIRRFTEEKAKVMGAVERGGKVSASIVADRKGSTLVPMVKTKVLPASVVYTDEFKSYRALGGEGYTHRRVNHSERIYVDGDVHTQTIEGFWALLKNGLIGVYHGVSTQHLQSYLDEYVYRYNHRDDPRGMFQAMLTQVSGR